MAKIYRVGLAGCGRMGATIDDEVIARRPQDKHSYLPYSHAAAVVACERTELVAVSDPLGEKAETIGQRYSAGNAPHSPLQRLQCATSETPQIERPPHSALQRLQCPS